MESKKYLGRSCIAAGLIIIVVSFAICLLLRTHEVATLIFSGPGTFLLLIGIHFSKEAKKVKT